MFGVRWIEGATYPLKDTHVPPQQSVIVRTLTRQRCRQSTVVMSNKLNIYPTSQITLPQWVYDRYSIWHAAPAPTDPLILGQKDPWKSYKKKTSGRATEAGGGLSPRTDAAALHTAASMAADVKYLCVTDIFIAFFPLPSPAGRDFSSSPFNKIFFYFNLIQTVFPFLEKADTCEVGIFGL